MTSPILERDCTSTFITIYRTVGVVNRLAARSVICDNAQLSERAAAGQRQLAWAVVINWS